MVARREWQNVAKRKIKALCTFHILFHFVFVEEIHFESCRHDLFHRDHKWSPYEWTRTCAHTLQSKLIIHLIKFELSRAWFGTTTKTIFSIYFSLTNACYCCCSLPVYSKVFDAQWQNKSLNENLSLFWTSKKKPFYYLLLIEFVLWVVTFVPVSHELYRSKKEVKIKWAKRGEWECENDSRNFASCSINLTDSPFAFDFIRMKIDAIAITENEREKTEHTKSEQSWLENTKRRPNENHKSNLIDFMQSTHSRTISRLRFERNVCVIRLCMCMGVRLTTSFGHASIVGTAYQRHFSKWLSISNEMWFYVIDFVTFFLLFL